MYMVDETHFYTLGISSIPTRNFPNIPNIELHPKGSPAYFKISATVVFFLAALCVFSFSISCLITHLFVGCESVDLHSAVTLPNLMTVCRNFYQWDRFLYCLQLLNHHFPQSTLRPSQVLFNIPNCCLFRKMSLLLFLFKSYFVIWSKI